MADWWDWGPGWPQAGVPNGNPSVEKVELHLKAQVYSETRPAFALGAQTPLYKSMQEYANQPAVQELLQRLASDLFTERPDDALDYISKWVDKEKTHRSLPHNTKPAAQ